MISSGVLMARLEWLEEWGYLTASLSFLLLGMITFVYGWYAFFISFWSGMVEAALHLTNNLLFVVILLELFRTLLNFLKSHTVTLEPFLIKSSILIPTNPPAAAPDPARITIVSSTRSIAMLVHAPKASPTNTLRKNILAPNPATAKPKALPKKRPIRIRKMPPR